MELSEKSIHKTLSLNDLEFSVINLNSRNIFLTCKISQFNEIISKYNKEIEKIQTEIDKNKNLIENCHKLLNKKTRCQDQGYVESFLSEFSVKQKRHFNLKKLQAKTDSEIYPAYDEKKPVYDIHYFSNNKDKISDVKLLPKRRPKDGKEYSFIIEGREHFFSGKKINKSIKHRDLFMFLVRMNQINQSHINLKIENNESENQNL